MRLKASYQEANVTKNAMKRAYIIVSGSVQGVSYRYYALREARHQGITGTVRNLPNGSVEIIAEGDEDQVSRFIEFCRKGSPSAAVEDVRVTFEKSTGKFSDFNILG